MGLTAQAHLPGNATTWPMKPRRGTAILARRDLKCDTGNSKWLENLNEVPAMEDRKSK